MRNLTVRWVDGHRQTPVASNPDYPHGQDIDLVFDDGPRCFAKLPYPTPRCGAFEVVCIGCGLRVIIHTGGRADDPRSIQMSCRFGGSMQ